MRFADLSIVGHKGFLVTILAWLGSVISAPVSAQVLQNSDMERTAEGGKGIPGWTIYRWEGEGQVEHAEGVASSGRRAALIRGTNPGKIAIFQEVTLRACSYRLTAMVAGHDLVAGSNKRSATLHIAFANGTYQTQSLFDGGSAWRSMSYSFKVPADGKAIIYFFNYGSGAFFVDDVRLDAEVPCTSTPAGLSLAKDVSAPLNYSAPLAPVDRLLAGYCARSDFAERAVCKRLMDSPLLEAQPARVKGPALMADFETLNPFANPSLLSSMKSWRYHSPGLTGTRAALLPGGAALISDLRSGIRQNWTGYDWLVFDVENSGHAPQTIAIEIRDDKTTSYRTRINWELVVSPGRTTVHVPLQAFVGEKSYRNRRRLDMSNVTRLVLSTTDTASDLVVDTLRLERDLPFTNDFPELIKLDAGPPTAPVMTDFTALLASTHYRPERGYGLSADAKIARVEDRRHPDNLLRDWISFRSGGLDFDLPNETYRVWMMLEDPGYWEYYPSYPGRAVWAEGRKVLDDQRSAQDFLARYLRHADDEDLPGDDVWKRYISARYKPLEFDVDVKDGQLNIRFEGQDPYANALSALIIYPKSKAAQGDAFVAELWERLKRDFDRENREASPPRPRHEEPQANALGGALSVFQRDIDTDVHGTDWPDKAELVSTLSLTLAQNESSVLMLGLYAHSELALVGATLALPGFDQTPLMVRYKTSRATQDGTAYWNIPRVLDPLRVSEATPLPLAAGRARSLWFDLHAPHEAKPGRHNGQLRLRFSGGATLDLPVGIDVAPWRLPPADVPVGYLSLAPAYPSTNYREVDQRRAAEMTEALHLILRHGFNTVTGGLGGPNFQGYADGRIRMDFTKSDQTMEAIVRVMRPSEVNTYMGLQFEGLQLDDKYDTRGEHKKPYPQVLNDILAAIKEHGERRGWPPMLYSIGDEPFGDEIDQVAAVGRLFRQSASKPRTSAFTSLKDPGSEPTSKLAGAIDRLYLNVHSERGIRYILEKGSECALYNQENRYRRGIYLLKMKFLGCKGHLRFALSSPHADPWYDLDGREADISDVLTHRDGRLRLAVEMLRYRQSVTDYRYLLKLEQLIGSAKPDAARASAKRWLDELIAKMRGESGNDSEWNSQVLNQVRQAALQQISALAK